jgi:carbon monoxide dehydrogenase subunit G
MAFRIGESFRVEAPLEQVWRYVVDPHRVVRCMPGAELTSQEGERAYVGRVKVKVGPVTASYAGRAQLVEVDETLHVVRLSAEGRESGGAGSAKLTMMSRVVAMPDGATEIHVEAEVDIAGKIVQFGRGMIEGVSRQLFRQFAECVRAELATPMADAQVPRADDGQHVASITAPHAAKPVHALPLVFGWLWSVLLGLKRFWKFK